MQKEDLNLTDLYQEGQISQDWKKILFNTSKDKDLNAKDYNILVKELEYLLAIKEDGILFRKLQFTVYNHRISEYGFQPSVFKSVLFYILVAEGLEDVESSYINAYKLTIIFGDVNAAIRYLNITMNTVEDCQSISDACLLDIPADDLWEISSWQKTCQIYMFNAEFRQSGCLFVASKIPLQDILSEVGCTIDSLPDLETRAGKLIIDAILYRTLNIYYPRAREDEFAARIFLQCRSDGEIITENVFNQYLDKVKPNIRKLPNDIPNVFIDGKDCGCDGYYLVRLSDDDPKGVILPYINDSFLMLCSDYEDPVIDGMTSVHSGYYIICRGKPQYRDDTKNISPRDIIAHSWSWKSQHANIVLDSIEKQPWIDGFKLSIFISALAKKLVDEYNIIQVNMGTDGSSLQNLMFDDVPRENNEIPIQYTGYRNSRNQYRVYCQQNRIYAMFVCEPEKAMNDYLGMTVDEKAQYEESIIIDLIVQRSSPSSVAKFIDDQSSADAQNLRAMKILYASVQFGNSDIVRFCLLNYGDEVKNGHHLRKLSEDAVIKGHLEILMLFLDRMETQLIDSVNHNQTSLLHVAAQMGYVQVVKLLIERMSPSEIDKINHNKMSALHFAARNRHGDVVKLLIDKMDLAVLDKFDENGMTPLFFAASSGSFVAVKLLLEKMTPDSIEKVNVEGKAAFYFSTSYHYYDISREILKSLAVCDELDQFLEEKTKLFSVMFDYLTMLHNTDDQTLSSNLKFFYKILHDIRRSDLSRPDLIDIISKIDQVISSQSSECTIGFWKPRSTLLVQEFQKIFQEILETLNAKTVFCINELK